MNDHCAYPKCKAPPMIGFIGVRLCERHWDHYAALEDRERIDAFRVKIGVPPMIRLDRLPKTVTITTHE